MFSIILLF